MAKELAQLTSYFAAFLISLGKWTGNRAAHKPQYKPVAVYRVPVISGEPCNLTTTFGVSALSLPPLFPVLQLGHKQPIVNVGCEKTTSTQPLYALAPIRPWFAVRSHTGVKTFFQEVPHRLDLSLAQIAEPVNGHLLLTCWWIHCLYYFFRMISPFFQWWNQTF